MVEDIEKPRSQVFEHLRDQLPPLVDNEVFRQVGDQVVDQVGVQVRGQVGGQMEDHLYE